MVGSTGTIIPINPRIKARNPTAVSRVFFQAVFSSVGVIKSGSNFYVLFEINESGIISIMPYNKIRY